MLLAAARFVTMTANEATSETEMTRLWVGGALTSYGNEYGLVAAVAETRDSAIAKMRVELHDAIAKAGHVPSQRYAKALLGDLDSTVREVAIGPLRRVASNERCRSRTFSSVVPYR